MTATKNRRQLTAAGTAVGASVTVSATELNATALYFGTRVVVKITNGASAPTTAPIVTFYTGGVTGEKAQVWTGAGDTTANSVNYPSFVLEQGDMFVNVDVKGGATNGSIIEVYALEATGL